MLKKKTDLRQAMKDRLIEMGHSIRWLSKVQTAVHSSTCCAYFYSGRRIRSDAIEEFMRILGMEVNARGKPNHRNRSKLNRNRVGNSKSEK